MVHFTRFVQFSFVDNTAENNQKYRIPDTRIRSKKYGTQAIIIRDPRSECHRDTSSDGVYEWLHVS